MESTIHKPQTAVPATNPASDSEMSVWSPKQKPNEAAEATIEEGP